MSSFGAPLDRGYVVARNILLDALAALAPYGSEAVIVVGAQAIYLRCDETATPISPFTLDSDLVIDVEQRTSDVPIRAHLESLGYTLRNGQPGLYQSPNVPVDARAFGGVDLFVPAAYAVGAHRRDASIPGDPRAARRQRGLEVTLLDRSRMIVGSLQCGDARAIEALVAGPAALLVAKLIKIKERFEGDRSRVEPKDVLDVYRLLYSKDAPQLVRALEACRDNAAAWPVIGDALATLRKDFTGLRPQALGVLEEYLEPYPVKAEIVEATRLLSEELLTAFGTTDAASQPRR